MKTNVLLLGLLAACSAGGKTTPTPTGGALGTSHDTSKIPDPGAPAPAKNDPNLAFRLSYSDPGGMWMPQQMTLPGHTDTFTKMGVKLDAKTLSDPLQAPLAAVVSIGGCTASFVSN